MKLKIIRFQKRKLYNSNLYYIVVIFQKKRSGSFFFEKLGFLNLLNPRNFSINLMRLGFWLNSGAKLHKNVKKYLAKLIY